MLHVPHTPKHHLVGQQFYHRTDPTLIYKITKVNEDRVVIGWNSAEGYKAVTYDLDEVLSYLSKHIWIYKP